MFAFSKYLLLSSALAVSTSAFAGPVGDRIYPAPDAPLTLSDTPDGTRFVDVMTNDGLALRGLYRAPTRPDRPLLLVFHGNASSALTSVRWLSPAAADGYGILAAEYRGYSGGPGKPSASGLERDAQAFYAEARRLAGGRPVWVVGHSLGGAVAFGLARHETLEQLVTIGAFTSLKDMVRGIQRALVPDDYRNIAIVPALDEPFALIHGLKDEVVPWTMGQEMHKAAFLAKRTGRSYVVLEGTHHPAGTLVTAILNDIQTRRDGAAPTQIEGVKIVEFGKE